MDEKQAFHEIRGLTTHLFDLQGIDPQGRMAYSDAKSTKIYTQNYIDWVVVPYGEIKASKNSRFLSLLSGLSTGTDRRLMRNSVPN